MDLADKCYELERLLNPTEQLLCVAAAVHRSADGQRSQRVWLGVGRIRNRLEYAVFIFARAAFACLQSLQEWIYCILPVVANIRVDTGPNHCTFAWCHNTFRTDHAYGFSDDCIIEDIQNGAQVLALLLEAHRDACIRGLVFHEEQRVNHREIWRYQDCIPIDLARLSSGAVSTPGSRRRTVESMTMNVFEAHKIRLLCITWNVGATLPEDGQTLEELLQEEPTADLVCIGLQETCELSAKRLIADGDEWFAWRDWAEREVNDFYHDELELLTYSHLVGLLILIFTRSTLRDQLSSVRTNAIGIGVAGCGGNKGAVSIRFDISSTSFCFVNAHLASGQPHYIERCQHFRTIMKHIQFSEDLDGDDEDLPRERSKSTPEAMRSIRKTRSDDRHSSLLSKDALDLKSISFAVESGAVGRETYKIEDHDHIFWVGDTNSRLHWPGKLGGMPIPEAMQMVQEQRFGELLALDQLNLMRRDGLAFQGFQEHRICFLPSYKWQRRGDALDVRSQKHIPAWTDRILFRSTARPAITAHRYDMHPGLRQSDHRPVFACFTVPWIGSSRTASLEATGSRASVRLAMEPREVVFDDLKPDRPQECTVRLAVQGVVGARFKVFLKLGEGKLKPVSGRNSHLFNNMGRQAHDFHDATGNAVGAPLLTQWLAVTPAKGTICKGQSTKIHVSACVGLAVLRRQEFRAPIVVRLQVAEEPHDFELVVRATIGPSVMRAPLQALADLGSCPMLSSAPEGYSSDVPNDAEQRAAGSCSPPKEVMAVMQWVLQQSRDTAPRCLDWWPDPLLDGVCRGKDELCEVQRYIEQGLTLPVDDPQLPPRSAALFLLRWVYLLPEPILTEPCIQSFDGNTRSVLQAMPALPRNVLVCIVACFAQLVARHGPRGDLVRRLAGALTQQARPLGLAEQLLSALLPELTAGSTFPPPMELGRPPTS